MQKNLVYVGTYTDPSRQAGFPVTPARPVMGMTGPTGAEGIYVFRRDPGTGALDHQHTVPGHVNPAFLALDPTERFLYAVNEMQDFEGAPTGAVSAFALDAATGPPRFLNQVPSGGGNPCHLAVAPSGRHLVVANHEDARVAVFPIAEDGRLGPLIDLHEDAPRPPDTGRRPHAHFVLFDPSGRFVLSSDTGTDRVMVYRYDAATGRLAPHDPPWAGTHEGGSPRHLAFAPGGRFLYANGEADLTLSVFAYDPARGALDYRQRVPTVPTGATGRLATAQMQAHPDGRFVYVANRGHDSIGIIGIDEATGEATWRGAEPTRGSTPRYFAIDPEGRFLYVGNQNSNTIIPFRIDRATGALAATAQITTVPAPTCIAFTRRCRDTSGASRAPAGRGTTPATGQASSRRGAALVISGSGVARAGSGSGLGVADAVADTERGSPRAGSLLGPAIYELGKEMNTVSRAIVAGAAGACTTNFLHELTRRLAPDAPRVDLLGMQALARLLRAGGAAPPTGQTLYNWTLAGDLASNSAYFGAVAAGPRERAVAVGAILGVAAGAGAVLLPPYLGLSGSTTGRSGATAALTVGLYAAGGLVAGAVARALSG